MNFRRAITKEPIPFEAVTYLRSVCLYSFTIRNHAWPDARRSLKRYLIQHPSNPILYTYGGQEPPVGETLYTVLERTLQRHPDRVYRNLVWVKCPFIGQRTIETLTIECYVLVFACVKDITRALNECTVDEIMRS